MAKITISSMLPQTLPLKKLDPTGETKVTIVPPDWNAERRRGSLLSNRKYSYDDNRRLVTEVNCNIRELWESELWLTFGDANLVVELDKADGKTETLSIVGDKETITFSVFMDTVGQMPPQVVYAWHELMVQAVPEWADPF